RKFLNIVDIFPTLRGDCTNRHNLKIYRHKKEDLSYLQEKLLHKEIFKYSRYFPNFERRLYQQT
uniref:hypothetical protein n=1 Tax=Okeania sp. SIO2F4 TaxID=2607790 RepID=UPI0025F1F58B